ncbi:RNA polymerase sigma factor [Glaciibacter psychrotolerans]|uniref:RNA polymerase sigma factor n=1 Tax=Glaciibacter psychrotolerans TaxID=670054 RepID=A0A7Z0ED98_9MICO|nr:RNA polymerase sigma factor [Leifsonia psychrotolerans]NYJ19500.1 RNA polymerase sigma-70 factor (ECF subfamily) [Leifsonia psychrotolerans]
MALTRVADNVLVSRTIDGDKQAFEVLIRRHAPGMRAYAQRLLNSSNEADDVVQETFITAWEQLESLSDYSAARAWLMRVVSRKSFDVIRARKPTATLTAEAFSSPAAQQTEHIVEIRSAVEDLSSALLQLPTAQRECWLLYEVGGCSYDEIAEQLGISHPAVRGTLARARATLIRTMEGWR